MPKNKLSSGRSEGRRLNLLLALLLLWGTVGCASKQQTVFVDLNQVLAAEGTPAAVQVARPTTPVSFGPSTLTFPALPPAAYTLGSDTQRIKDVERVLQISREDTLARLEADLKASYLADLKKSESLELAKLKPGEETAFNAANSAVAKTFEEYANKRGPMMMELATLVGFPDPDPNSERIPPKTAVVASLRFERAKKLREDINALDLSYRSERKNLFEAANSEIAANLQRVESSFEQQRSAAEAKAAAEAQSEVSREQAQLQSVLANKSVVAFPAQPGRAVTVPGSTPPPPAPVVVFPGRKDVLARMRAADASDLKIWAALRGYVISSNRHAGRDATAEFIEWKKMHLASP